MQINFTTREQARKFASARTAKGFRSTVKDNGKQEGKSRYSVPVGPRKAK